MKTRYLATIALTAASLLGASNASALTCWTSTVYGNTQIGLDFDPADPSAACHDVGTDGSSAQPKVAYSGTVIEDNGFLELPTGTLQQAFSNYLIGDTSGVTGGTLEAKASLTGTVYLLFKFGGGQNDPYWWAISMDGLDEGQLIDWGLIAGQNALSGIRLYGGTPTTSSGFPVPEPASSLVLLGLGLLGVGFTRRSKKAA